MHNRYRSICEEIDLSDGSPDLGGGLILEVLEDGPPPTPAQQDRLPRHYTAEIDLIDLDIGDDGVAELA